MAKTNNDSIQALVADFTAQLTAIVRRSVLEQVLESLEGHLGTAPSTGARRGRPKGSKNAPKAVAAGASAAPAARLPKTSGRRTNESMEQSSAALLDYVTKNPGQRGEQIAKALRTDVGTMRLPMKKLIADKKVRTQGQRRGMTYYAAGAAIPAAAKAPTKKAKKASRRGKKK